MRLCVLAAGALLGVRAAPGYVEAPYSLGRLLSESTNVVLVRVEKLDKEKNLIVYRKVRDIKGTHQGETIKHNIGRGGFHPREWQTIMKWAAVGRSALLFHNRGAGEMCIKDYWYQCYRGDWWRMSHGEPYLLRSYAGKPEKLAVLVAAMLAGREVVTPCMVDGDKQALQLRTAKVQRLRASLKLTDYNPKRDFVGWGVEEFRAIGSMPGFSHYAPLSQVSPGAAGVAAGDLNGDGKPDLCLFGASRMVVLQNSDGSLNEMTLPLEGGARAAGWADYDGDGKPDLLLATPAGPRLLGFDGKMLKDLSAGLPAKGYYNLTAAAWIDYDADRRPDILLADGYRGLRLYRNLGAKPAAPEAAEIGDWHYAGPFDNTGGRAFYTAYPPERGVDLSAEYVGKAGEKVTWKKGKFREGQNNSLRLFPKREHRHNTAIYLYRQIDLGGAAEVPVDIGREGTLAVWVNGRRVFCENVVRRWHPREASHLKLKLTQGPNKLLLKVCCGGGQLGFRFTPKWPVEVIPRLFEDVSDKVGLGAGGIAGTSKGDHLAVADVDADGRADFLYSAQPPTGPVLALNKAGRFVQAKAAGIAYQPGRTRPAFGDFNGDGRVDLFVPQKGTSRLFRNAGGGRFAEVTAAAGALAKPIGHATCAAWADFDNHGRRGLFVGCLNGPNRYFRNLGDGTFADASNEIGLDQRIFNTRGLGVMDLNADEVLDVVFSNEGQPSAVLLGRPRSLAAFVQRGK